MNISMHTFFRYGVELDEVWVDRSKTLTSWFGYFMLSLWSGVEGSWQGCWSSVRGGLYSKCNIQKILFDSILPQTWLCLANPPPLVWGCTPTKPKVLKEQPYKQCTLQASVLSLTPLPRSRKEPLHTMPVQKLTNSERKKKLRNLIGSCMLHPHCIARG